MPRELTGRLLPNSWRTSSIAKSAANFDGKRIPVRASDRAKRNGEFPYYGASGVIDTIDDFLFDGDFLLIGEDGANLISRSTPIAFLASGRFWVNNHAHVLEAGPDTSNQWLCWFVSMIDLVPYVTGSAQPKLTQAALNRIRIPLPSLDEQQEIIRCIEDRVRLDRPPCVRSNQRPQTDRSSRPSRPRQGVSGRTRAAGPERRTCECPIGAHPCGACPARKQTATKPTQLETSDFGRLCLEHRCRQTCANPADCCGFAGLLFFGSRDRLALAHHAAHAAGLSRSAAVVGAWPTLLPHI